MDTDRVSTQQQPERKPDVCTTVVNCCPRHAAAQDMYEALEELEAYWSGKRTRWAGIAAQVGAALYEARGRKETVSR